MLAGGTLSACLATPRYRFVLCAVHLGGAFGPCESIVVPHCHWHWQWWLRTELKGVEKIDGTKNTNHRRPLWECRCTLPHSPKSKLNCGTLLYVSPKHLCSRGFLPLNLECSTGGGGGSLLTRWKLFMGIDLVLHGLMENRLFGLGTLDGIRFRWKCALEIGFYLFPIRNGWSNKTWDWNFLSI